MSMVALGGAPDVEGNTENVLHMHTCAVFLCSFPPVTQKHSKCQKSFFSLIGIFLKKACNNIDRP